LLWKPSRTLKFSVIYYVILYCTLRLCSIIHFDITPEFSYYTSGHNARRVIRIVAITSASSLQHTVYTLSWYYNSRIIIIWQYIIQSHSRDNFLIASRLSPGSNLISAAMSLKTSSVYYYILFHNIIIVYYMIAAVLLARGAQYLPPLTLIGLTLYESVVCIFRFGRIFFVIIYYLFIRLRWTNTNRLLKRLRFAFIKINKNQRNRREQDFFVRCSTHFKQIRQNNNQSTCFHHRGI